MGEFSKGGPGPLPSLGRKWVMDEHEKELIAEGERERENHRLTAGRRRWWWPFGGKHRPDA